MKSAVAALVLAVASAACARTDGPAPQTGLVVSPTYLRFATRGGGATPAQDVVVSEAAGAAVPIIATTGAPWLILDPRTAQTPALLHASVNARDLAAGTYRDVIRIHPSGRPEGAAQVLVELTLETPGFTALGGPSGGPITALAVDPADPGHVLAGSRGGHLYESRDGGDSFTTLPSGLTAVDEVSGFALLVNGRGYLSAWRTHADGAGGVLRTDDHGATWTPTTLTNLGISAVAASPDNPDLVIAGSTALWRSTDGGASWSATATPASVSFVSLDPNDSTRFLVGTSTGALCRTADGALLTCDPTALNGAVAAVVKLASGSLVALDRGWSYYDLWTSPDGALWTELAPVGLPPPESGRPFTLAVVGEELWFLARAAWRSTDAGATFTPVGYQTRLPSDGGTLRALVAHPNGALLGHDAAGVLRYQPGAGLAPTRITAHGIRRLEWHDATGTLFCAASLAGYFRWQPLAGFEGLGGTGLAAVNAQDISVHPENAAEWVVSANDCDRFYRSTDAGNTWALAAGLDVDESVNSVSRAPEDPDVIWLGAGYQGLFRSLDAGATFAQLDPGYTPHVAAVSRDVVIVGRQGAVRYDAVADTVTSLAGHFGSTFLRRTPAGRLFAAFEHGVGLYRSTDAGQSFTLLGLENMTLTDAAEDPLDPTHLYVAGDTALWESKDDGATWTDAGAPFTCLSLAFDPQSGALYLGTDGGGLYRYSQP